MHPPRLPEQILRRCCRGEAGADIAADLAEEYALKLQEVGLRRARAWYWRQAVASVLARRWLIWRGGDPPVGRLLSRAKVASDLRCAWRSFRLRRGSATAIVAVVGLGIGLVTTVFAIADPFVLRPLPFRAPHELITIRVGGEGLTPDARIPTLEEWRRRASLLQGLTASRGGDRVRLDLPDGATLMTTAVVDPDYFAVLGLRVPAEDSWRAMTAHRQQALLLTPAGIARLRDNRNAGVLTTSTGETLLIAGTVPDAVNIVFGHTHGLVAGDFDKVIDASWSADGASWSFRQLVLIARVQPGVTPEVVRAALAVPLPSGRRLDVDVKWLSDAMTQAERPLALGALAASGLILFVCAGNVGNLFIARRAHRAREFAVRAACGAGRGDLIRLTMMELFLLVTAAVAIGLLMVRLALPIVVSVLPAPYARLGEPSLSHRVFLFAALAALAVVVVGLVPAGFSRRWAQRPEPTTSGVLAGRRVRAMRFAFGAVQAAFAMILAVGASMVVRSYVNLWQQDVGFDQAALSVRVNYPSLPTPAIAEHIATSLTRLRALQGVEAASATTRLVLDGETGGAVTVRGQRAFAFFTDVWPDFVKAAGMAIVQGRALAAQDDRWRGVVVNEAFARTHWPASVSVLGQVVQRGGRQAAIVGVVRDGLDGGPTAPPQPTIYSLYSLPAETRPRASGVNIVYVLRQKRDGLVPGAAIRRAIAGVNPHAVIEDGRTIGERFAESLRTRSFVTLMLTAFCLASGAIGLAGLVGIVSFIVARRTRELAIRAALGASRGHVRRLVAEESLLAAGTGGAAGLFVGRWLSTWLESFVYGITAGEWTTALSAAAMMLLAMTAASLIAAQRAVTMEPTLALRLE